MVHFAVECVFVINEREIPVCSVELNGSIVILSLHGTIFSLSIILETIIFFTNAQTQMNPLKGE